MFLKLLNRDPLFRVDFEYFVENLSQLFKGFLVDGWIGPQFHLFDVETLRAFRADLILHIDTFEWKVSKQHSKEEHSNSPHINFVIIYLFFEYFRCHIGCGATESVDILIILTTKT